MKAAAPSEMYMHAMRQVLRQEFPDASVFVGGGWNLFGAPVAMWEIRWDDDNIEAGKIELTADEAVSVDAGWQHGRKVAEEVRRPW